MRLPSIRRLGPACALLYLLLGGCATLSSGGSQTVPIESFPPGATVKVGEITATTPCEIRLSRRHDYEVILEKPGYKTARVALKRATNESAADGNAFWFGLTGLTVDLISGAYFELHPTHVVVSLEEDKKEGETASGAPAATPASAAPAPPTRR